MGEMGTKTRSRQWGKGVQVSGDTLEEASKLLHSCPGCGREINTRALVDAFNQPDGWAFYGEPGNRWICCRAAGYVHFRVRVRGVDQHRLAIITGGTDAIR